jgi:thioester reductase-like protein
VVVLAGDVSASNLGLSGAELDLVLSDVSMVLHCAASVALDADIQATLRCVCAQQRQRVYCSTHGTDASVVFLLLSCAILEVYRKR